MIFVSCSGCRAPMLARDRVCPHCGTNREPARRAGAAIAVLGALTGCLPIAEPAYGIADSGTSEWGDTSDSSSMSTTYDGPYTTTTSPGTTQGTSPTPDPTNYTVGDDSSSDGESSSSGGSDTSDTTGDETSSDTSGDDDSSSSSDDGGSSGSSDDGGSSST
jgi:hypothetical protein